MPALLRTEFIGKITWLGLVPDRETGLSSVPRQELHLTFGGVPGESHSGLTRKSCVRVTQQYVEGTEIRNTRQLSILSAEELSDIAADMKLGALNPAHMGASMVIEGIPDFTHLPPSSRLQAESGAMLVVDMENRPCNLPAKPIEVAEPGHGRAFKAAAKGRRGITAWVEREGVLRLGETIRLHIPDQRAWIHRGEDRR